MIEDSKRAEPRFKGMSHGIKTIVAEEGYRGLYRGVGPVVSQSCGYIADCRFCAKEPTRLFDFPPIPL